MHYDKSGGVEVGEYEDQRQYCSFPRKRSSFASTACDDSDSSSSSISKRLSLDCDKSGGVKVGKYCSIPSLAQSATINHGMPGNNNKEIVYNEVFDTLESIGGDIFLNDRKWIPTL